MGDSCQKLGYLDHHMRIELAQPRIGTEAAMRRQHESMSLLPHFFNFSNLCDSLPFRGVEILSNSAKMEPK